MNNPSLSLKAAVIAGFVISCTSLFWLTSNPKLPLGILPRLGLVASIFCTLACLVCCWAVSAAYLARKWNWSPQTCARSGLPFLIIGAVLYFFAREKSLAALGVLLIPSAILAGSICGKLVYPKLTSEQIHAPAPPPSLFPQ